jgi:hypothetical protein
MLRRPARPAHLGARQSIHLDHHLGGEADEYYYAPEGSQRPPVHQIIRAPRTVLAKNSNQIAETHIVSKTTKPSISSTIPPPPTSVVDLGMSDERGEFLFPFGGRRVRYCGGKIHYSPVYSLATANELSDTAVNVSEDRNNPALSPRPDLEDDSDEDRDILVAQPANHRSPLSDGSSDDWPATDDDTNIVEMAHPVTHWSPLSDSSSEDMVEGDIDLAGIATNRPARHRVALSVSSSGNSNDGDDAKETQMAQPAGRHMTLLVCSSPEDQMTIDSDSDKTPRARPASQRRALSVSPSNSPADTDNEAQSASQQTEGIRQRTPSDCFSIGSATSNGSDDPEQRDAHVHFDTWRNNRTLSVCSGCSEKSNSLAILEADTTQDIIIIHRGSQRFSVVVNATTRQSMMAELCNASDPEPETAGKVEPHKWLTGLAQPDFTIKIPSIDSAYRHSEHAGVGFVESPEEMDIHHGLETLEFNDRGFRAPDSSVLDNVPGFRAPEFDDFNGPEAPELDNVEDPF